MKIGVLGISFHSCEISLREEFARACQRAVFPDLPALEGISFVTLSTCNRTEIYFEAEDLSEAHSRLLHIFRLNIASSFDQHLYSFFGMDCFCHLACVTSGLDSSILGETEIQGQVKTAYENASLYRELPTSLHFLFQKSLMLAKKARHHFPIFQHSVSLPEVLLDFIQVVGKTNESMKVFFVGNSEINRKIAQHILRKKTCEVHLCTRSPQSATDLEQQGMRIVGWDKLDTWKEADIVICGTHHSEYVIKKEQDAGILPPRTQWIFDLGMPRNVDPAFRLHPHISLCNMEQLSNMLVQRQQKLAMEKNICESWLRASVERQISLYYEKRSKVPVCTVG